MVRNNLSNYSVSFEIFFSGIAEVLIAKQKFNLQGKKVTENKLKSSDYEINILFPVIFKMNFSFAIHQSKTFVAIVVITFYVLSLMLVKKQ